LKKVLILCLIVILSIALAGCGNGNEQSTNGSSAPKNTNNKATGNEKQVELTLAFPGDDGKKELLEKLLETFYEENPNIKVNILYVASEGWGDYFNKLQTMVAGGKAPDVVRVAIEGIEMFVQQDLALALDEYMDANPEVIGDYSDIHPKLQDPFVIDGKTYGFAWDWNNVVMHFNTDMLKAANLPVPSKDWTKDDFIEYAQALTSEKDGKKTYGFAIPNYYFGASAWLFNNEASVLNEEMTTSKLDDPNAIEVMQLFQDLIYKYKVSPVPNPNTDMINQLMAGQVGMISAGKWPFGSYMKNDFTAIDVQFLPTLKTNKVIFGVGAFPVMKSTKHPEESYKLTAFLSGPLSQTNVLSSDSIPARISVMTEVLPKTPATNWAIYAESADIAKAVESPTEYAAIAAVFDRYMSAILSNQMDAATAMKKAKGEIDAILKK